jgi:histidinol-phosphate phosphatase family protein
MPLRPAVFLDKDGTLVVDVPFNVDPEQVRLTPGAGEGLARLQRAGFALVVVSNQPGIALERFQASSLAAVDARLRELLSPYGVSIDATYYCPHAPGRSDGGEAPACTCRKPAPGLLFHAARDLRLHLPQSWMIGDILNDIEAGRAAGCRTILLDNGGETEWRLSSRRQPHFTVSTLLEAASVIERAGMVVADNMAGGAW